MAPQLNALLSLAPDPFGNGEAWMTFSQSASAVKSYPWLRHWAVLAHAYPDLWDQFQRLRQTDRWPHALLITGPEGVGKSTLLSAWAVQLLAESDRFWPQALVTSDAHPLPESGQNTATSASTRSRWEIYHRTWNQMQSGGHPEFLTLSEDPTIAAVRALRDRLGQTRLRAGWRVVHIEQVHKMNASCTNALLKVMETPPPQTLFLMGSSGPVAPTLASRCTQWTMRPLAPDAFRVALEQLGLQSFSTPSPDPRDDQQAHLQAPFAEQNLLEIVAAGCIGRAVRLAQDAQWTEQTWNFFCRAQKGPVSLPQPWIEDAKEHISTVMDLFDIWIHRHMLDMYDRDQLERFWSWRHKVRARMSNAATFHADPHTTFHALYSEITSFFCP